MPWDGRLNNMADNRFAVSGSHVLFKILKDEDMSAELFPIRITISYRTASALKFGVCELRAAVPGGGR